MNTAAHPVAPEDLMSLFDGELPVSEAQAVSSHLAHCAECTNLAKQFRATSEQLSSWVVPAIPTTMQESLSAVAVNAKPRKTSGVARWNWKPWAIGSGSALVTALLLIFVLSWNSSRRVTTYNQESSRASLTQFDRPIEGRAQSEQKRYDTRPRYAPTPLKMVKEDGAPPPLGGIMGGNTGGGGGQSGHAIDTNGQLTGFATTKPAPPPPMIARTVSLTIQVKDLTASRSPLETILARHRGYAAQLSVTTPQDAFRSLLASLRIPASELTSTIADLKSLGRVEDESQSGEEVTQEHDDLLARLKTARETEARFQTILQQRTGSVADVLEVEESIARVRGEIESMESEQDTLEHRVAFATVQLNLSEESKTPPGDSVAARMSKALAAGYRNATGTLLGIVIFAEEYGPTILIWLAILAVPVILLRRRYVRSLSRL
jgi:Domain of unknown function (DUF4349)